jgi:hypothetical protein
MLVCSVSTTLNRRSKMEREIRENEDDKEKTRVSED